MPYGFVSADRAMCYKHAKGCVDARLCSCIDSRGHKQNAVDYFSHVRLSMEFYDRCSDWITFILQKQPKRQHLIR